MNRNVEFFFGIVILFLMALVLWKFIEPVPIIEKAVEVGTSQKEPAKDIPQTDEIPFQENSSTTPPIFEPTEPVVDIGNAEEPVVACAMDAKMCPDGSYVGRVGPRCEFASCPNEVAEEKEVQYCGPRSTELGACISLYDPVCAAVQVECVTTPCNPVPQTFGNSCEACQNERVISYTEGACGE